MLPVKRIQPMPFCDVITCTQQTKKLCYLAMVRPILEYASTVWSPYTNSNIYMLDMVQRRAARFITNNYSPWASVTDILDHLNLPTLEQRRNNLKLVITIYKMVHRQVHIDNRNYLIPTASQTRGHDQRFCSQTPELTLTFTLITPLQLNYGITYLAVLWNHCLKHI